MSLPTNRQFNRLPRRFPAGTVYVVEGCGGQYGRLRVSSRYVVMPGGKKVEIPADFDRAAPARLRRRDHSRLRKRHAAAGPKTFGVAAKKFVVVAGTDARERRS